MEPLHDHVPCLRVCLSSRLALILSIGALAGIALAGAPPGEAATPDGRSVLAAVDAGRRDCASLSTTELAAVGEYTMGRMAGTPAAHESMDRAMRDAMGASFERRAHVAMGRRFTGCGATIDDPAFGGMMAMMGGLYGAGTGTMMGTYTGAGGMMRALRADRDDDSDAAVIAMGVLMSLIALGLLAALVAWRPRRAGPAGDALQVLRVRLARGEIDPVEFQQRRAALGGGRSG